MWLMRRGGAHLCLPWVNFGVLYLLVHVLQEYVVCALCTVWGIHVRCWFSEDEMSCLYR
ncbi:hypothetical protein BDW42DRAFT_180752 [Aspergillus taichungensis]|uniref:Uncharacterized protein n=1 Tax=Aspergillus taichungensis TaxID=482145 RepID=A0A2J5HEV2_9EURO|nr:hypothetical protein BDW42DRAFT_180752 [Aspergillus taichungensis]